MVRSAQHVVVLAHHSTWGRVGIRTIATLDRADIVASDVDLPTEARDLLAATVGRLLLADPQAEW
jgi:DeoR/GlpR family transcriptional regulator of sugar metabolism